MSMGHGVCLCVCLVLSCSCSCPLWVGGFEAAFPSMHFRTDDDGCFAVCRSVCLSVCLSGAGVLITHAREHGTWRWGDMGPMSSYPANYSTIIRPYVSTTNEDR